MNTTVLNTLPLPDSGAKYATITKFDGTQRWTFLLMPTRLNFKRPINYSQTSTNIHIPIAQYVNTEGFTLTMKIPLYSPDKDLTGYIKQLEDLSLPSPITPPILIWQWGNRILSPCVLTQCDRQEFDWFPSGSIRGCNLSVSLTQVNEKLLVL